MAYLRQCAFDTKVAGEYRSNRNFRRRQDHAQQNLRPYGFLPNNKRNPEENI